MTDNIAYAVGLTVLIGLGDLFFYYLGRHDARTKR